MEIDRRAFLSTLGGAVAIETMSYDALADALEHHMADQLDQAVSPQPNQQAEVQERPYRRGTGDLFLPQRSGSDRRSLKKLEPMPLKPTLLDFFKLRFAPASHVLP